MLITIGIIQNTSSCAYAERLLKELILLNEKVKQPINMYEVKKGIYYAKNIVAAK